MCFPLGPYAFYLGEADVETPWGDFLSLGTTIFIRWIIDQTLLGGPLSVCLSVCLSVYVYVCIFYICMYMCICVYRMHMCVETRGWCWVSSSVPLPLLLEAGLSLNLEFTESTTLSFEQGQGASCRPLSSPGTVGVGTAPGVYRGPLTWLSFSCVQSPPITKCWKSVF